MTKKSVQTAPKPSVLEITVFINPRGRCVAHGTVLDNGVMRTVKHELSDLEKSKLSDLILTILTESDSDPLYWKD